MITCKATFHGSANLIFRMLCSPAENSSRPLMSGISPQNVYWALDRDSTNAKIQSLNLESWILENPVVQILVDFQIICFQFFWKNFWVNLLLSPPPLTFFVSTNPRMLLGVEHWSHNLTNKFFTLYSMMNFAFLLASVMAILASVASQTEPTEPIIITGETRIIPYQRWIYCDL